MGFTVLTALGVIWSEVTEWDNDGLESDEVGLSPSLDCGDLISDLPEAADNDVLLSRATSHLARLRCHKFSQASRFISDRA